MKQVRSADAALPAGQTVLAFGETLVDQFRDRAVLGGAPFNVSCHLRAFGAHPVLVTRAGRDLLGERLLHTMSTRGLDRSGVQIDPVHPTGRVAVNETPSGHAFEILPDQAYDHIQPCPARMVGLDAQPAMVYFGTLSQRGESRDALRALLETLDSYAFLDVNLRDPWIDVDALRWSLHQARAVKLNEDELTRLSQMFSLNGTTTEARADVLVAGFGLERLIVTCGAAGAWTLDPAGGIATVSGAALTEVVDTVGAGDGFAAVFILGMLRNWPLSEQLARADAFARAICRIRGAVPESPDFYRPFIEAWQLDPEAGHA